MRVRDEVVAARDPAAMPHGWLFTGPVLGRHLMLVDRFDADETTALLTRAIEPEGSPTWPGSWMAGPVGQAFRPTPAEM